MNITRAALVNVFFKLTLSHLWAIEAPTCARPSTVTVQPVHDHCPHCTAPLTNMPPRRAHAFTYNNGRVPVIYNIAECRRCMRLYLGCWELESSTSANMRLISSPDTCEFFPVLAQPKERSIAFVSITLLKFLRRLLAHGHVSFDAVATTWAEFFKETDTQTITDSLRRTLFHAWIFFEACTFVLQINPRDLDDIVFRLDKHDHAHIYASFGRLEPILQKAFLERYARQHACRYCHQFKSIGFDATQSLNCRVCAVRTHKPTNFSHVTDHVDYGCPLRPLPHSTYCAAHVHLESTTSTSSSASHMCPKGHTLEFETTDRKKRGWTMHCDMCDDAIPPGSSWWRCPRTSMCDFDFCTACAEANVQARLEPPARNAPAAEDDLENPCGIKKLPPPTPPTTSTQQKSRYGGSVFARDYYLVCFSAAVSPARTLSLIRISPAPTLAIKPFQLMF